MKHYSRNFILCNFYIIIYMKFFVLIYLCFFNIAMFHIKNNVCNISMLKITNVF